MAKPSIGGVPPSPPRGRSTVPQRLREHLLAGLIVVIPLMLTVYIAGAVIRTIDDRIAPLIPDAYNPATYLGRELPGFGLVFFVAVTILTGLVAKGLAGRRLVRFGERLVERLPVIRSIYGASKQIAEAVFTQSDRSFSRPCLIEYPTRGTWAVAFVAGSVRGEIPAKIGAPDTIAVFMATAPNPITGFLFMVPRSSVVMLDMSIEDAAKIVISAGLVTPTGQQKPSVPQPGSPERPAA